MSELTEQQRVVRVLELMEENYNADPGKHWRPFSAEAAAFDYVTYIGIQKDMRAGDIPSPATDPQAWTNFMAVQRTLAAAE